VRRQWEKENRKSRDDARKDYNDTVRVRPILPNNYFDSDALQQSLTLFVRKRDPRYKAHLLRQSQLNQPHTRPSGSGMSTPNASNRTQPPAPSTYVEQDWQKIHSRPVDDDLEWAAAEGGEDPEEWECVACGKTFRSEAAWDSHERSKKHTKEVERLRREMEEDEQDLGLGRAEAGQDREEGGELMVEDGADEPPRSLTPTEVPDDAVPHSALADTQYPPESAEIEGMWGSTRPQEEDRATIIDGTEQSQSKVKKSKPRDKPEPPTKTEKKYTYRPVPDIALSIAEDSPDTGADTPTESAAQEGPQTELSKREKRRLREAKKAREGQASSSSQAGPPFFI
jgi:DnaJ homolog subfamily A member 5